MRPFGDRLLPLWGLLLLLVFASASGPSPAAGFQAPSAPPPVGDIKETAPAYSEDEAREYVTELQPLVERVLGRKFKVRPQFKLTDRVGAAESLSHDFVPQFKNLLPQLGERDVTRTAQAQARLLAPGLIGKYGIQDKTLYLLPKNVQGILAAARVEPKHLKSIVKLAVAHELTHALQDQEVDLAKALLRLHSLEESQAFNALMEGQAVFVQDRVGKMLGLDEAVVDLSRLLSAGAIQHADAAEQMLTKMTGTLFEQVYIGGQRFVAYFVEHGGMEKVWSLFGHPPTTTAMIDKPATYNASPNARRDYASIVEGLEQDFGDRNWRIQNIPLGVANLRAAYANLDVQKRDDLLDHIETVQALVVQDPPASMMGNVSLIVLTNDKFAKTAVEYLEDYSRMMVKQIQAKSAIKISDPVIEDFNAIKADVARQISFTLQAPGEPEIKQTVIRVARGRYLVEIIKQNIDLTPQQLAAIADKVLARASAPPAAARPLGSAGGSSAGK
jgi:hypothetical protein